MNDLREIEDRLRDAARAYAGGVEPAPDAWERLGRRTRAASRRRRAIWIGGTSAVAAAAFVAGVLLVADNDSTHRVETRPAGSGTSAPAAPRAPVGLTYLKSNGTLVTPDGTSKIDLAPHELIRQIGYDPRGRLVTLGLKRVSSACGVMSEYGPANHAASVTWFSFSPDGDRLAYATRQDCIFSVTDGVGNPLPALSRVVVRDLTTDAERVWTDEPSVDNGEAVNVGQLAWSPDGTHLAIDRCGGHFGCDVAVLDVSGAGGRILDARRIAEGFGPAWMADGRIAFQPSDTTFAFVDRLTGEESAHVTPGGLLARTWAAADDLLVLTDDPPMITFDGRLTMKSAGDSRLIDVGVDAATWVDETAG